MAKRNGMNMKDVSSSNRSLVMRLLFTEGAMSRKEIAERTGLTSAAITKLCTKMIEEGLIRELGVVDGLPGRVGRREILIEATAGDKLVLGIHAEVGSITFSISMMNGRNLHLQKIPFTADVETLMDLSEEFVLASGLQISDIDAIGICILGSKAERGFGKWDPQRVKDLVTARHKLPVVVANNVYALAQAEMLFNKPDQPVTDPVLFVKWGAGIGSCVVNEGKILSRNREGIAALGHFIVNPKGSLCRCGRRGCLETEIGDSYLQGLVSDEKVDMVALSIINAATLLDASSIILCGPMFAKESVVRRVAERCGFYNPAITEGVIRQAQVNDRAYYIGAVALCVSELILGLDAGESD